MIEHIPNGSRTLTVYSVGEAMQRAEAVQRAAAKVGAVQADIPGLWNAPGHPELTTGQLLDLASRF